MNASINQEVIELRPDLITWRVSLAMEGLPPTSLRHVVYTLHPSFPNPVRISKTAATNFAITVSAWGTFDVRARVVLVDGNELKASTHLTANDQAGNPMHPLDYLFPGATAADRLDLARRYKGIKAFGFARQVLRDAWDAAGRDSADRKVIGQQLALCTSKDASLPLSARLDEALKLLDRADPLDSTRDGETLGIAGSIFKRRWEFAGQFFDLERSLTYYYRGYDANREIARRDPTAREYDRGYTGINAAFLLDLLADEEERRAGDVKAVHDGAADRRSDARKIREELIEVLEPLAQQPGQRKWWLLVTLAEAYLGTEKFDDAKRWLAVAKALPNVPDWERETTTRQLAALIHLRAGCDASTARLMRSQGSDVLVALTEKPRTVARAFTGKIGLGLSGGGFRASLFHIGVLARLAELDVLRHVEVLSCVSGGSIIGAHYYLEVRKLLQTKSDDQITREDYLNIVSDLEEKFLLGVQRNIRTRVAGNVVSNLKMVFAPNEYSRTERIGELYERELFGRVEDGEGNGPRWINDLFITPTGPQGQPIEDFSPKLHNWDRDAKVPVLVLNATTLNTGHTWQFTASWMGEPPAPEGAIIDTNDRLRRPYYAEAPGEYYRVRLGAAVAASACVPGLFDPLTLPDLYPDRTIRLVDGGVHDNQGVQGLLDQDCTLLLISDASGQMNSVPDPGNGIIGVPLRVTSVLQARVREAQYRDLEMRSRASLLKGLMFLHLKKGLEPKEVGWVGLPQPAAAQGETPYGIPRQTQELLAGIRTDLDSFCDVEAYALMLSGYRMAEREARGVEGLSDAGDCRASWRFMAIEDAVRQPRTADGKSLLAILRVASKAGFKIWMLDGRLRTVGFVLLALAAAALVWIAYWKHGVTLLTVGSLAIAVVATILGFFVSKWFVRVLRYRETLVRVVMGVLLALFGWIAASIHIGIFDRWYLARGKLRGGNDPRRAAPLPELPNESRDDLRDSGAAALG